MKDYKTGPPEDNLLRIFEMVGENEFLVKDIFPKLTGFERMSVAQVLRSRYWIKKTKRDPTKGTERNFYKITQKGMNIIEGILEEASHESP